MTQQQWGSQPPQWGRPPQQGGGWSQPSAPPYPQQYGRPPQGGFAQAPNGISPYGQRPGPGPMGPGQFPPPRRPKGGGLRTVLAATIVVALVALAGLAFANLTTETPTVAYQNDDYTVPPPDATPPELPVPQDYNEAERVLTSNRLYSQSTPKPVRCDAQPINVATADSDQLKEHFESLMECLVRVWQPPVDAAGYQIVRPTVTIYGDKVTTKCGDAEVNAFYCSGDQQIYFSNRLADFVPIVKRDKWAADVVMAHEFGHALQARTAILISSHAIGQQSGDQQTELEMSRRLEVQADCFSGMFIGSVSQSLGIEDSDREGIEATYRAVGDDVVSGKANVVGNHGLARSRAYWGTTGIGTSDVGECNTFTAEPNQVR